MLHGVSRNQELPIPPRPTVTARIEDLKQDAVEIETAKKLREGTRDLL